MYLWFGLLTQNVKFVCPSRRTEVGEDKDYFEAGAFPTASARL